MKKRILIILILGTLLFFPVHRALAVPFPFVNISNNSGVASSLAGQFSVDVTDYSGGVLFVFSNTGPINSVITDIYWDDPYGRLDEFGLIGSTSTSPSVSFLELIPPPELNFPEGNTIGFNEDFGVGAISPGPTWGIGNGEMLGVPFDMNTGVDLDDIIADLSNLEMRIGLHVQSIGIERQSDSFVSSGVRSVPEPAAMLLLGGGLVCFAVVGRKKFFKK